jgi:glutamyl/glutaminyl-tRNA synthetase
MIFVTWLCVFVLQLNRLVREKWVDGWDDPRLMTLSGLRRRGVTPDAINTFVRDIGITRRYLLIPAIFSILSY